MSEIERISGLTIRDWIEIRATLKARDDERFDCSRCLKRYRGRTDEATMLQKFRENQGCFQMKDAPIHSIGDDLKFSKCIGNYTSPSVYPLLAAYERFRSSGVTPYPGGYLDQPNKILDAFEEIASHDAEQAEAQMKKLESVNRSRAKSGGARGR